MKLWIAARDARDTERWKELESLRRRVAALEKRIIWVSALAAAIGAAAGRMST